MSEQAFNTISEDEISLKDIIDFLLESWKVILSCGIAGGLIGLGYAVIAPSKYQAIASIQVTKVAGIDVEAPSILIEKLKMPTYYSEKTYIACGAAGHIESGEFISNTLKPSLSKNTPIITISFVSASSEDAKKCLGAILDDVRANQSLLAKPFYESKGNQLVSMKLKLEEAQNILKKMPKQNNGFDFSDSKFSASTLLLATTLNKQNEIQDLRTQINDLEITMLEPQTKPAFFTTPIYAPKQKVSPKRTKIIIGGLIAGLIIGLLLMIGKHAYGAYKSSNQQ
jgi:hypothetical protein